MAKSAAPAERPLSPHLQIYRWPVTMASSIAHRASGIVNSAGLLLLTAWVFSVAMGPAAYGTVNGIATSWIGLIVLYGFTVSLSYHLLNGVRHLFWDMGKGLLLPTARSTAWLVLIGSVVLATAIWAAGFAARGAI